MIDGLLLKALTDFFTGNDVLPFLHPCFSLVIKHCSSNIWPIRNAAVLLLSSIYWRMFGRLGVEIEHDSDAKGKIYFKVKRLQKVSQLIQLTYGLIYIWYTRRSFNFGSLSKTVEIKASCYCFWFFCVLASFQKISDNFYGCFLIFSYFWNKL